MKNKIEHPSELTQLEYLTTEQAAILLQCTPEHIRRQIRAGKVPGVERKLGLVRIRTSELLANAS